MRTSESSHIGDSLDLTALQRLLREHPVQLAILFGSHATRSAHSGSDIDIAIDFDGLRPSDPDYNAAFLGLSADLSETLGTDDIDLVDLHALSPVFAESIFDNGVLLIGDQKHVAEVRQQVTAAETERQPPRERLDAALDRIDAHLDGDETTVPATSKSENDG